MTATPSVPGTKPPRLVVSSGRALHQESAALKRMVEEYGQTPHRGSLHVAEQEAWKAAPEHSQRAHRRRLWQYGMQLCRLLFANVYDHMWSTGSLLGAGDSIPLYSHHTLTRVACEGAARIGYLLDPAIGYEHRLLRSAVFALADVDARVTAARDVAAHPRLPHAADEPTRQRDELLELIRRAGITICRNKQQQPTRLEIGSPVVDEPCKTNLTELVKRFYPDRPGTYRLTSAVVHSNPWVLNDTVTSSPFTPELVLEPDVRGIGTATLTTIDASIIMIESYARYYGHDPAPAVRKSKSRAQVIDGLLREWITNPLGR